MNSLSSFQNSNFLESSSQEDIHVGHYSYSETSILGRGSSSVVYKGKKQSSNEIVAIKVIELKRLKTTIQKVLLNNEKKVIQQLIRSQMRGTSKYIQILETKTHIYMVMKYEQGGDLQKLINEGKLIQQSVSKYLIQILTSYIALSQNKIIHRDLKPANILLDENGHLMIADFGFAIIQSQDSKIYNYCLGSPAYSSPESLQHHQYGIKSDIWAIGVIIYKMLTRRTPWMAKNNEELIKKMKDLPINRMFQGIKNQKLKAFISGCCAVDLNQRFGINQLSNFKKSLQKGQQNLFGIQSEQCNQKVSSIESQLRPKQLRERNNQLQLNKTRNNQTELKSISMNNNNEQKRSQSI